MRVLTVFAHPGPRSFCHAVLDRFDAGLRDAGHTNEILNLYAIGFDPILRARDSPSWLTESIPDDMLDRMRLRESLLDKASTPSMAPTTRRGEAIWSRRMPLGRRF
jgi:NAD(P)H dehydrogenase (quinone)